MKAAARTVAALTRLPKLIEAPEPHNNPTHKRQTVQPKRVAGILSSCFAVDRPEDQAVGLASWRGGWPSVRWIMAENALGLA
jgi:hypothetical protein